MEKLIAILAALVMLFTGAFADTTDEPVEPAVTSNCWEETRNEDGTVTIALPANMTTGYEWTGFVMGGDAAELDEERSGYVADPNPDQLDGLGGTHYFTIRPLQPGEAIIRLIYSRGWETEQADEIILLVFVDEDMTVYLSDVTEDGVLTGTVTEVNDAEHTVVITTERWGDVVVTFAEQMAMPVMDETIMVFTNGIMAMSLPPIMNALGWESIPSDLARDAE